MIVMVPILFVYNQLVQTLNCPRSLVTIVSAVYALGFAAIAVGLSMPSIGLDHKEPSPDRWLGWLVYWCVCVCWREMFECKASAVCQF